MKSDKGYTLIELVVGGMIFALASIGIYRAYIFFGQANYAYQAKTIASNDLDVLLNRISTSILARISPVPAAAPFPILATKWLGVGVGAPDAIDDGQFCPSPPSPANMAMPCSDLTVNQTNVAPLPAGSWQTVNIATTCITDPIGQGANNISQTLIPLTGAPQLCASQNKFPSVTITTTRDSTNVATTTNTEIFPAALQSTLGFAFCFRVCGDGAVPIPTVANVTIEGAAVYSLGIQRGTTRYGAVTKQKVIPLSSISPSVEILHP